jgi:hypothetical protein
MSKLVKNFTVRSFIILSNYKNSALTVLKARKSCPFTNPEIYLLTPAMNGCFFF